MFGNERRAAIKQRAKLMGRMVMLLTDRAKALGLMIPPGLISLADEVIE
jgi:hypothetical protein